MKTAFNQEAKDKLASGIKQVADAVSSTLGPYGRNVVFIDDYGTVRSTKDGVTVAKTLKDFEDPIENIGAQMIKQASIKTADKAGDGTTTSTVLSNALIQKAFSSINPNTNVVLVKKGIEAASQEVIAGLKEIKRVDKVIVGDWNVASRSLKRIVISSDISRRRKSSTSAGAGIKNESGDAALVPTMSRIARR